ncbi:MAG: hypothetical protein AAGG48_27280 [Planctomycetota bacterium]
MSDPQESKRTALHESWIEALLISVQNREDHSQRVAQAMSQIESIDDDSLEQKKSRATLRRRRFVLPTFGLAATVVFAMVLLFPGSSRSATAAIQRSLDVASERLTRKYVLQIDYRSVAGKSIQIDSELYVQGSDRFVLRHPGLLPGKSLWLGQDGSESWIVPTMGPVVEGDSTVLSRFLSSREELDTPYLHVSTVLKRMMSRGYRLEVLADESVPIPSGVDFECQHIRAELGALGDSELPQTIDLWTSRGSGMAIRLDARWERIVGRAGRESVVIVFDQEEPGLGDEWFRAHTHVDRSRSATDSSQNP